MFFKANAPFLFTEASTSPHQKCKSCHSHSIVTSMFKYESGQNTMHCLLVCSLTKMRPVRYAGELGGGNPMEKRSIDLEHVKELWDEWEIHCLILVSLFLQFFLFLTADMRRRSGSRVMMTTLWLAYLLADTVAIFVLGHLAVYVRGPSHELMFFWAPFVLVHLGGQDTITAFSKQDNELWTRHLLSLVSQVGVAAYVVSKSSWRDTRLRAAMVLMFLHGFMKYAGRTLCLYKASPENLGASSLGSLERKIRELQHVKNKANSLSEYERRSMVGLLRFEEMFVADRFWDHVTDNYVTEMDPGPDDIMLVDAPVNDVEITKAADELPVKLEEFKNSPDRCMAYQYMGALLVQSYKVLYTKTPLLLYVVDFFENIHIDDAVRVLLLILIILIHILFRYLSTATALALFTTAEKKSRYSQADIIVSYLLLVGAMVLDIVPVFTSIVSYTRKQFRPGTASRWVALCFVNFIFHPLGWQTTKLWSEELVQYSMIRRHTSVQGNYACISSLGKWIDKCFGALCVEFFDLTRTPVTDDFKLLVLDKLLLQIGNKEWDLASFRGERALGKWMDRHHILGPVRTGYDELHKSINSGVDFPISVVIWHIATDICYFSGDKGGRDTAPDEMLKKMKTSRELSLYMMYLVFKCDVMLTTISRLAHKNAHEGLTKFISGPQQSPLQVNLGEEEAVKKVFEAMKKKEEQEKGSKPGVDHEDNENEEPANKDAATTISRTQELLQSTQGELYSPVLPRAYAVAKKLMDIDNEADRWDLISEVWLEMLFYTAPRCGAAFHYEHLSTGGEFISHVLLLMRQLGPFLREPGA